MTLSIRTLLFIAALLQIVWGLVPVASKIVIDEIPVELYITIRWTISGILLVLFMTVFKKWQKLPLRDVFWISLLGILGFGVASMGTLYGLKIGGVVNFALVSAIEPLITSVIAILVLRERPRKLFYLALLLSILGLASLAIGKYEVSSWSVVGLSLVFILSACVLEALIFVFSKKFKDRVSSVQYLVIAQIAAASLMWILQGSFYHQTSELALLSIKGMLAALFVSIVACVLCYLILYWLLKQIDGHRLALFDGFHTLSAAFFGMLLFDEPVKPLMILGGVLVLAGLILGNWPQAHKDPQV